MSAHLRSLAQRALGAVAVLALAGCGGADGVPGPASGASGGEWSATLGGHPVELEGAGVVCEAAEGSMQLRIGDIDPKNPSRATGIHAIVGTPEGEPEVRLVNFSLPDGRTLLYSPASAQGPGVPSTSVSVEGDTYTVDGAGTLHDPASKSGTTAFTLSVTCA